MSKKINTSVDDGHQRVDFLDGIRGWAALIVVLDHTITLLCQYTSQYSGPWFRFISDGHLAVLVFFVLSGYALSVSNFADNGLRLSVAATARIFRLSIPILVTSLIAYLLLKLGLFYNLKAATTPEKSSVWLGTFYHFDPNILNAVKFSLFDVFFKWDSSTSYNISCWTMQYELLGSFMIYGYIAIFRRNGMVYWVPALILAAYWIYREPLYACFIGGYLIAELNNKFPIRSSIGLDFFAFLLFLIVPVISTFCRITDDKITCFMAFIVVLSVSYSNQLRRFFSCAISSFLGRISFPLYLIQIIVICSFSSYLFLVLPSYPIDKGTQSNIIFFSTIILCLIASVLLMPVERFSVLFSKKIAKLILKIQK